MTALSLTSGTNTQSNNRYIHLILPIYLLTLCLTDLGERKPPFEDMLMLIVGGVAGGLLILMLVVVISVTCHHKRKNKKLKRELTERKYAEITPRVI